jgi:hypothetical protein
MRTRNTRNRQTYYALLHWLHPRYWWHASTFITPIHDPTHRS